MHRCTQAYLKRQSGFTLIELIIVIVILGILAVTAAPRFIDVSSDANIAALKGMGASIKTNATLVYAKAAIQGLNSIASSTVDIDNDGVDDVKIKYGFPSSARSQGMPSLLSESFEYDWTWGTNNSETKLYITTAKLGGRSGFYINISHISPTDCYLVYETASIAGAPPSIEYVTSGC